MRIAGIAAIALVTLPAAGLATVSVEDVLAEIEKLPQQRPGQYRRQIEFLEIDAPGDSKEAAQSMLSTLGENRANSEEICLTPEEVVVGPQLVRAITEDDCTFEHIAVAGETVTAVVQCASGSDGPNRVKMSGRVGPEDMALTVVMEQKVSAGGPMRMKMRISSRRIGDCA